MIPNAVLDEMSLSKARVEKQVSEYADRILLLAESFRIAGKKFTFAAYPDLDKQVNSILVELSDAVLTDMVYAARKGLDGTEEDNDGAVAWARARADAQNTVDKYSSHLKYIIEGWLAIGFANKLSKGEILSRMMAYMENPYITPMWRKAFDDGAYVADIVREKGWTWGKGTPISPVKGMSVTESYFINSAYQRGMVTGFSKRGAIGYRVHRGSGFYCPECDALCVGIHPIDEIVLPEHPNCCCYMTPVFAEDLSKE